MLPITSGTVGDALRAASSGGTILTWWLDPGVGELGVLLVNIVMFLTKEILSLGRRRNLAF